MRQLQISVLTEKEKEFQTACKANRIKVKKIHSMQNLTVYEYKYDVEGRTEELLWIIKGVYEGLVFPLQPKKARTS